MLNGGKGKKPLEILSYLYLRAVGRTYSSASSHALCGQMYVSMMVPHKAQPRYQVGHGRALRGAVANKQHRPRSMALRLCIYWIREWGGSCLSDRYNPPPPHPDLEALTAYSTFIVHIRPNTFLLRFVSLNRTLHDHRLERDRKPAGTES